MTNQKIRAQELNEIHERKERNAIEDIAADLPEFEHPFESAEQNEQDNHAEAHRRAGTALDHDVYSHCDECGLGCEAS